MAETRTTAAARATARETTPRGGEAGFTLVEMLAALGILLLGIVSLMGALTASIAQRRTTDARIAAATMCEQVLHRLQEEGIRRRADAVSDLDLELVQLPDQTSPDFPGMSWSATAIEDQDRPDVWLLRIEMRWLEDGADASETFLRVLPKQLPLGERVRQFRDEPDQKPVR